MKRIKVLLLLLPVLLFVALWEAIEYKRSTPAYILAQYHQHPHYKDFLGLHLTDDPVGEVLAGVPILRSTWFSNGSPDAALLCTVNDEGRVSSCRNTRWGLQDAHESKLTRSQITSLMEVLQSLPSNVEKPSFENLLIFSFQDGETWTTHIYDRSKLPDAIIKIHTIIGASSIAGSSVETAK